MEKNTLIALISIGFISVTALVLSIVGVSNGGHECGFDRGGMMPGITEMRQGMMKGQRNPGMKQLSGAEITIPTPTNQ